MKAEFRSQLIMPSFSVLAQCAFPKHIKTSWIWKLAAALLVVIAVGM